MKHCPLCNQEATDDMLSLNACDISVDLVTNKAYQNDIELNLTRRELDLLKVFLRFTGETISRKTILKLCFEDKVTEHTNSVDVLVNYLRNKIDIKNRNFNCTYIQAVRGEGYKFKKEESIIDTRQEDYKRIDSIINNGATQ